MKWFWFVSSFCGCGGIGQVLVQPSGILSKRLRNNSSALPVDEFHCPASHVIKGNFSIYNSERCIFPRPVLRNTEAKQVLRKSARRPHN